MSLSANYNELEVVKGCIKNDRIAQEVLYRRFAPQMFTITLSYSRDRATAKDILQEGFLKVFDKISTYHGNGVLGSWIRQIIVNTAIDHVRKYKHELLWTELGEEEENELVDFTLLETLNLESVLMRLNELPNGARVIFNLYAIEGYTHREIAEKLGISEGTSKSQFNRARTLLQKMLAGENVN